MLDLYKLIRCNKIVIRLSEIIIHFEDLITENKKESWDVISVSP